LRQQSSNHISKWLPSRCFECFFLSHFIFILPDLQPINERIAIHHHHEEQQPSNTSGQMVREQPQDAHVQQLYHLRRDHPLQWSNHQRPQSYPIRALGCLLSRFPRSLCQNIFLHHRNGRIRFPSRISTTQAHLLYSIPTTRRCRSRSKLVPPTLSHRSRVPRR
jgi:hypothetical protein